MIVCIDGPAGAGKSTVARALARRIGFRFLDTGAMYRCVALAAVRRNLDWSDPQQLVDLAGQLRIELSDGGVLLDGDDVTRAIRTSEITAVTHYAADNPGVREILVQRQRELAERLDVVTEGRDQGTVVFPDAELKVFLTADPVERARRRLEDLRARGEDATLEEVLKQQELRDRRDTSRQIGPLKPADDAVPVNTDGLSPDEVVERLERLVRANNTQRA